MKRIFQVLKIASSLEPSMWLWLVLSCLVNGFSPLVNVIIPKYILDELLGGRQVMVLLQLIAGLAIGNFVFAMLKALCKKNNSTIFGRLYYRMNEKLTAKSVDLGLEVSESKTNLDLLERGKYGLYSFFDLDQVLQQVGSALITLVSVGAIIVLKDWRLIVVLLITNLLTIPAMRKMQKLEIDNAERSVPENREFAYYCSIATDFRYSKDLKIFNGIDLMLTRAEKNMDRILRINHEYFTKNGFWNGLTAGIIEIQTVILFGILGFVLLVGKITIGTFTMLYSACRQFGQSLNTLTASSNQIITMGYLFEPLLDYLALPAQERVQTAKGSEENKNRCLNQAFKGVLNWEFEDISFHYPTDKKNIIEHCSFHINSDETIALVGKNGAGKSTLVKLLCRFYEPQSGRILLNGVDIREISLEDYYRVVSPTFQDFQLLPFEIKENVACKVSKSIDGNVEEDIWKAVTRLGLFEWVQALPQRLATFLSQNITPEGVLPSGGQAQKIALARANFQGGRFVIMDEPTAALDPRSEEDIFNQMLNLSSDKTCLFISHRLSSTRFADRILVMDKGSIVEDGNHQELITKQGIYSEMYRIQAAQYNVE
jgi:ABC-type multidrug transport system fused ATPase/permease subunit